MSAPVLSVIVPAYNEEANISEAIADVLRDVGSEVAELEVVVVDDGSTDATSALVEAIAARDGRVRLVRQSNQGHGAALFRGIGEARGEWLMLIDSDRQVSLGDFAAHWQMARRPAVVLGVRTPRNDPWHRRLISRLMRLLITVRTGVSPRDAGAPYKIFPAAVWTQAGARMRGTCWIPSVLLAIHAMQAGAPPVVEVNVAHRQRPHGPSSLNLRRLARFCREGVSDISHFVASGPADAPRRRAP